jgi:hypothetical protein
MKPRSAEANEQVATVSEVLTVGLSRVGEDLHGPPACSAVETFRWNVSGHGDGPLGRLYRRKAGAP